MCSILRMRFRSQISCCWEEKSVFLYVSFIQLSGRIHWFLHVAPKGSMRFNTVLYEWPLFFYSFIYVTVENRIGYLSVPAKCNHFQKWKGRVWGGFRLSELPTLCTSMDWSCVLQVAEGAANSWIAEFHLGAPICNGEWLSLV